MASFIFTFVGCVFLVCLTEGRIVKPPNRRQYGGPPPGGCMERTMMCVMPLIGIDENTITALLESQGLRGPCQQFLAVERCLSQVQGCENDPYSPPEVSQMVSIFSETVNFVCREEIDSLEASGECLFGETLDYAVQSQCGLSGMEEICRLSEDSECAVNQFERICDNSRLAGKMRDFLSKIERQAGCEMSKVTKLNKYFNVLKMLRR